MKTTTKKKHGKKTQGFTRQDSLKKYRLKKKYRKPKGLQSKMRKKLKGHGSLPSPGYRTPKEFRGLTNEGFEKIHVNNVQDLEEIDNKKQAIVISSTVGKKKKKDIIEKAKKSNIKILNLDVEKFEKKLEEWKERKKKKKKKLEEKKKEKKQKSKEEKKEKEEKETLEEKAEEEKKKKKKEKDKLLTKKI